jgi:hypothetical protein
MRGIMNGRSPKVMTEYQNQMSIGIPIAIEGYHITTGTARSLISSRQPYNRVIIRAMAFINRGTIMGGKEKGSMNVIGLIRKKDT